MKRLMISAMGSGSGKTVVTCGLLALLKRRGFAVRSVKCGPDYIDPMFHNRVLGVEGANADLFLMGETSVRKALGGSVDHDGMEREANGDILKDIDTNASEDDGILVIAEGAMGFYDGIGGSDANSAWEIADRTKTPVILVLKSRGQSLSLAAQVQGFLHFRQPSHIVGLILTECSHSLYCHLEPVLRRETGLPVLGYLPPMKEAEIPQRHLGLITANEIADFRQRFDAIATQMERTVDVRRLIDLFCGSVIETQMECTADAGRLSGMLCGNVKATQMERTVDTESLSGICCSSEITAQMERTMDAGRLSCDSVIWKENAADFRAGREMPPRCRIAVANDEAFCFYYKESLEALREAGAEPVLFSPIHDRALPSDVSGLYLGGGYPELYARELGENRDMCAEIKGAFERKLPIIAECGGFLYLQKYLEDEDGGVHEMAGVFAGCGRPAGRLVRFGYIYLAADRDSLLFRKGEIIPAHEFHHWDTSDNGDGLVAVRAGDIIRSGDDRMWDGQTVMQADGNRDGSAAMKAGDIIRSEDDRMWDGQTVIQADGNRDWRCAFVSEHIYAGFPHLALGGELPLAERFVAAARNYGKNELSRRIRGCLASQFI